MSDLRTDLEALRDEMRRYARSDIPTTSSVHYHNFADRLTALIEKHSKAEPVQEEIQCDTCGKLYTERGVARLHEADHPGHRVLPPAPPAAPDLRTMVEALLLDAMQLVGNAHLWKTAPDEQWHMSAEEVMQRYADLKAATEPKAGEEEGT